jgi:DNA-directed RNA polymerase subunit RPC12/RpoP
MPIVTYACIDCGKERTDKKHQFGKIQPENYRCHRCAIKFMFKNKPSNKITLYCVECGIEKTGFPSEFRNPEGIYRCKKCSPSYVSKTPKWIASQKIGGAKRSLDPTWRKNQNASLKEVHQRESWKQNVTISNQNKSKDPDWIEKHNAGILKKVKTEEWINNNKIGTLKRTSDPKWKINQQNVIRNLNLNITYIERRLVGSTGQGFWYGHPILHDDKIIYCELWRDVNKRVHAFFDNKCCVCGAPETTRSHVGHHVFYVKKACCWHNEDGEYYTNLNVKTHRKDEYYIGDNPNYFVILCQSCHGKTNGTFENRKKWADYFKNMIDEEYGGKCYLTKEEYEKYKLNK